MNFSKILFAVAIQLGIVSVALAQKNITKPNIQGPNGVSVNTYTGSLFYQRQDLYIPGRGLSLDLTFSYNSVTKDNNQGYGYGWTHNYNMSYFMDTTDLVIVHMDGSYNRYRPNGSGGWHGPAGVFDILEQYQPNKFRLTRKDGTKYFFDNNTHKRLTKIQDRNNNAITLSYSDTLLTTLTDPSGRIVNLTWTGNKLTKITDPNTSPARMVTYSYDVQGNLVKATDPLGAFMQYEYDPEHKMVTLINEIGSPVNIEYNTLASVRRIVSCVGIQTITYNYELLKTYVVEKVGGKEQITTFQYDTLGHLLRQNGNCCGYDIQFEYDAANNIKKRTDANGYATIYTYDVRGNVLTEMDPLGNAMTFTYEPVFNQKTSEQDRNGNTTTYSYDANGNLTQVSRPLGLTESFTYDDFGNPLTFVNPRGHTTTYTYNANGDLATILDPELGLTTFTYDGVGNNTGITDPNSHTTSILYDLKNRTTKVTNALGYFVEYTYDDAGNQTSFKDEKGHVTIMTYDALNRLIAVTDPLNNTTNYQYDEKGNVTEIKDPNGNATQFEYNELNRLVKKTTPVGDDTFYDYDGVGNLTTVHLPGGNVVTMSYDMLNRVQSISDNIGAMATYSYDKNSNRLSVADANGNTTQYFYDVLDRVTKMEDPSGQSLHYSYDNNFNLTQVKDRKNNISLFTYDKLNRRITSKDPLNNTTTYAYDAVGNLLSLADANGNTTTYSYDAVNRRITEVYDNGSTRTFAFDPAHNLSSRTEPNGYTIHYTYDNADRLTARSYPGGVTETFTYDADGRVISATNPHSTVTLAYDGVDRLIGESLNGKNTVYAYNTDALTRQVTYPSGKVVTEYFDQRGRLDRIHDSGLSGEALAAFQYDPANRLLKKLFANGTTSDFAYDANSNVIQIQHNLAGLLTGFEYDHDPNDNKLYEKNIQLPARSNQFLYDNYNRLTQFKKGTLSGSSIPSPTDNIAYNYDPVHNRTTTVLNGITTTYASNVLNQYTMLSGGMNATLTYDNNGNLLSDGLHTYGYDYENRLIAVDGGTTAKYFYDALGRRIAKVAGTDSTFFYYAGIHNIEERGNGSVIEATYIFGGGIDEVVSMERGGNRYYYYANSLGSTSHVANSAGNLVERYEYDAYGNVSFFNGAGASISTSAIGNPYLYTGQRFDKESGLYYYKSRHYSARLGRFLQRDPLGYFDGMGLYQYAISNPANWIDPLGLSSNPCDKTLWDRGLDWLQTALDLVGLIPGVGEIADGINAGIYALRRDYANAALSAVAMVPFAGWAGTAGKFANKADNLVDAARAVDNIGDAGRTAVKTADEGIAYRAIDPQYAGSTVKDGFYQSGAPGRLGNDGIYANSTIEGAVAEFTHHNPGVTPAVFEVKYPNSPTLSIDPPSGYFNQPLPFTQGANILTAPSIRAPNTTNLLIRQGATPGKRIQ
jgi:RHS repeat-associated protein